MIPHPVIPYFVQPHRGTVFMININTKIVGYYRHKKILIDEPTNPIEYIQQKKLTYREAADVFNVELSTIYRWLKKGVQPSKKSKEIIK